MKIRCTDKVFNGKFLMRINNERELITAIAKKRNPLIGNLIRRNNYSFTVIEYRIEGKQMRAPEGNFSEKYQRSHQMSSSHTGK